MHSSALRALYRHRGGVGILHFYLNGELHTFRCRQEENTNYVPYMTRCKKNNKLCGNFREKNAKQRVDYAENTLEFRGNFENQQLIDDKACPMYQTTMI